MAFRQPTVYTAARQSSAHHHDGAVSPLSPQKTRTSHEWVSRLSDFGSLNTVARSGQYDEEALDDDEELDSLDDGLHAFREPSMYNNSRRADQSGGSILPVHDGLGTFAASSAPVQEQLWSFEQFNPYRKSTEYRRRRSSVQRRLEIVQDEAGAQLDTTRMERIEKWRIEQSKVLLEEMEKESRKRRLSRTTNESPERLDIPIPGAGREAPDIMLEEKDVIEDAESFWQRITRRVVHDLMGIDDSLLAIIFGESLASDEDLSTTPTLKNTYLSPAMATTGPLEALSSSRTWEDRLLDRVARELGFLVQQLSERSDAFGTYIRPATMDYAGIPIKNVAVVEPEDLLESKEIVQSSQSPQFAPTLRQRQTSASSLSECAAEWGIEEHEDTSPTPKLDNDYWERTPDLKTVFTYLQHRFSSQQRSMTTTARPDIATANTADSLRRAALIRQHHPLVSHSAKAHEKRLLRKSFILHHNTRQQSASLKRAGTSCASLSTKKSKRDASEGSRNYWDIGGSIGSGSGICKFSGTGAWGEV
ncbi:hypothetical protein MMC34_007790 [Xylographa carneopallida]|nr:hypothetical protein [Xylographa carneopallida]